MTYEDGYSHGWSDGVISGANSKSGIGDIASSEPGTGARFNAGKTKAEYLPWCVLVGLLEASPKYDGALDGVARQMAAWESRVADKGAARALLDVPAEHRFKTMCDVFDYGAQKYAAWNWAKGMPWSVVSACAKRHWIALFNGEENDAESGLSHWGHLACNLAMLVHYGVYYRAGDDRPPEGTFRR